MILEKLPRLSPACAKCRPCGGAEKRVAELNEHAMPELYRTVLEELDIAASGCCVGGWQRFQATCYAGQAAFQRGGA